MIAFIVALTAFAAEQGPTLDNPYRYPVTNPTELLEGNLLRKSPDEFRKLLLLHLASIERAFPKPAEKPPAQQVPDAAIAKEIIARLQSAKRTGKIKGFSIDISVAGGTVWLSGRMSSGEQIAEAFKIVQEIKGVKQIVNDDIKIAKP